MPKNLHIVIHLLISFFVGAILLCALSFIQKTVAGFDATKLGGYVVPFLFGGIIGVLIDFQLVKVNRLNARLAQRVNELEKILPVCTHCKKIRKAESNPREQNSWENLEEYISHHTSSSLSHGICPECMEKHYKHVLKS